MLPGKNRLAKRDDFQKVYKYGKTYAVFGLLLKIMKNDRKEWRAGVVVGAKFSKKAVERNRVKRQLRDIIGRKTKDFTAGYDMVFVVKKTQKALEYPDWELRVEELFKKANIK